MNIIGWCLKAFVEMGDRVSQKETQYVYSFADNLTQFPDHQISHTYTPPRGKENKEVKNAKQAHSH